MKLKGKDTIIANDLTSAIQVSKTPVKVLLDAGRYSTSDILRVARQLYKDGVYKNTLSRRGDYIYENDEQIKKLQ